TLRYFADRFGVPRASIEGTGLPERAIRRYARRGAPTVVFERQRRREGLMAVRTVEYFGFVLERDVEPLATPFPGELADAARAALVQALLAGETPHPDQGRLRLKEGQAKRLQPSDVPPFDRPVRFTVLRGKREALRSDSLDELRRGLSGLSRGERQRLVRGGRRGRRR